MNYPPLNRCCDCGSDAKNPFLCKDIKVKWPDGHSTNGIEKHIEDLKALFVYAPDTNIKVHPVKFGSGEWTSVIGVMAGTFTMPIGDGRFIQPAGKKFPSICTPWGTGRTAS
jgi:hypothetical protein